MTAMLWLLILLPLIGAIVVPLTHGRASIFFSSLSLVLSALLMALSAQGEIPTGLEVSLPWIPSLGLSLAFSVDALRLPILLVLTTAAWISTIWESSQKGAPATVLLVAFGATGALLSDHALVGWMFWIIATMSLVFAHALYGDSGREDVSFRYALLLTLGHVSIGAALVALQHFSEAQSLLYSEIRTSDVLGVFRPVMLIGLYLGTMLTAGYWPFHGRGQEFFRQTKPMLGIFQAVLLPGLGLYGFCRLATAAFPVELSSASPVLVGLNLLGALAAAVQIPRQRDLRALIGQAAAALAGLSAAGVLTAHERGVAGGFSLWIYSAPALIGLSVAAASFRRVTHSYKFQDEDRGWTFSGVSARAPWFAGVLGLLFLALFAAPGSPSLAAVLTLVPALSDTVPFFGVAPFLVLAILAAGLFWFYRGFFWGEPKGDVPVAALSLRGQGQWIIFVVVVVVLFAGAFPLRMVESFRGPSVKLLEKLR